jgi:hypothetical protein
MIMPGKGVTDDVKLRQEMANAMREIMGDDGFGPQLEGFVLPFMGQASLAKALNRSVTGSMNDLVFQAKFYLSEGELSPYDVSFRLNETPCPICHTTAHGKCSVNLPASKKAYSAISMRNRVSHPGSSLTVND